MVADPVRDQIIPVFYDGNGWNTNLVFANLDTHDIALHVEFWADDGSSLSIPLSGVPLGSGYDLTIANGGMLTLYTADIAGARTQGYIYVFAPNNTDKFSGYAVVRNIAQGLPDLEFTVPIAPFNENQLVMPFDNSGGYDTGFALVNYSVKNSAVVALAVQDQNGNVILNDTITIGPGARSYLRLSTQYPQLTGVIGSVFCSASGNQAVTGMGLRFGPNQSWTVITPFSLLAK